MSWFTGKMDSSAFIGFVWVSLPANLGLVLKQPQHVLVRQRIKKGILQLVREYMGSWESFGSIMEVFEGCNCLFKVLIVGENKVGTEELNVEKMSVKRVILIMCGAK